MSRTPRDEAVIKPIPRPLCPIGYAPINDAALTAEGTTGERRMLNAHFLRAPTQDEVEHGLQGQRRDPLTGVMLGDLSLVPNRAITTMIHGCVAPSLRRAIAHAAERQAAKRAGIPVPPRVPYDESTLEIPADLVEPAIKCPKTGAIMREPVTLASGITYDNQFLQPWLQKHAWDPVTGRTVHDTPIVNSLMRSIISAQTGTDTLAPLADAFVQRRIGQIEAQLDATLQVPGGDAAQRLIRRCFFTHKLRDGLDAAISLRHAGESYWARFEEVLAGSDPEASEFAPSENGESDEDGWVPPLDITEGAPAVPQTTRNVQVDLQGDINTSVHVQLPFSVSLSDGLNFGSAIAETLVHLNHYEAAAQRVHRMAAQAGIPMPIVIHPAPSGIPAVVQGRPATSPAGRGRGNANGLRGVMRRLFERSRANQP